MNVSPEAAELRHDYGALELASMGEGCRELGALLRYIREQCGP
jgi:hypothetical protein